jgi:hypothetical protein
MRGAVTAAAITVRATRHLHGRLWAAWFDVLLALGGVAAGALALAVGGAAGGEAARRRHAARDPGRSNRAIGERLAITEHTVEKHVRSIFSKLSLQDTPDDHRRVLAVLRFLDSG